MLDDLEVPEEVTSSLSGWAQAVFRLGERLTEEAIVSAWIAGLIAGTRLKVERGARWVSGPRGGYPRPLPFAVQFPCPFGHRTEDRRDRARVQIIIEANGWWSLDPDSPCAECSAERIERWLVTCPRCAAGVDDERHWPGHDPFDGPGYDLSDLDYSDKPEDFVYDDSLGFDASPLAWVVRAFARQRQIAQARWWWERTPEAEEWLASWLRDESDRERYRARELERARGVLTSAAATKTAKPSSPSKRPEMSDEDAAALLDRNGVPPTASQDAAWNAVKDLPGCPSKRTIERAVNLRKSRSTSP